jgi:hypothetical protein
MAADIPVEEAKAQLAKIQKSSPQNQKCIDCGAPSPTWASPMYGSSTPAPLHLQITATPHPVLPCGPNGSLHVSAVFGRSSVVGRAY